MLAFLLGCALLGLIVVAASLGAAVLVVLRREADLVIQVDRLTAQLDGVQEDRNDLAGRLTRRKHPGIVRVPSQRKAS